MIDTPISMNAAFLLLLAARYVINSSLGPQIPVPHLFWWRPYGTKKMRLEYRRLPPDALKIDIIMIILFTLSMPVSGKWAIRKVISNKHF